MTALVRDFLDLPDDISPDAFIQRVDQTTADTLKQYVLPQAVKQRLGDQLRAVGQRLVQGKDIGRFVYGTFGSGKSHLLQVLGKMLERDELVYEVGDAGLRELRQEHPWLDEQKRLVVRVNMMGKRSLLGALYEGYQAALPDGAPSIELSNHERIFGLIDQDAERMGGKAELVERLKADGIVPSVALFDRKRTGPLEGRLEFAAQLLQWRNHGEDPLAADAESMWLPANAGFDAIARHAKSQGYEAIGWLVDELVIWIRGKKQADYAAQINDLSSLVDHDGKAARPLPFFVALAVQTDITETCPEDMSESGFRQHLGFIQDRFQPPLLLEDTDLYEVCERRVLRRKEGVEKEWSDAVDGVMTQHRDAMETLQADISAEQVRGLYPFHPALLRVLTDVTQAFSRSRTGVQLLYALLASTATSSRSASSCRSAPCSTPYSRPRTASSFAPARRARSPACSSRAARRTTRSGPPCSGSPARPSPAPSTPPGAAPAACGSTTTTSTSAASSSTRSSRRRCWPSSPTRSSSPTGGGCRRRSRCATSCG